MRRGWRIVLGGMLLAGMGRPWGAEGHRVIARIAAKHLAPGTAVRVSWLLGAGAGVDALSPAMADAAAWADSIKESPQGAGTDSWHFLDLAAADGLGNIGQRCGNNCVTALLRILSANLKTGASLKHGSNTFSAAQELKFVIHFMGDVHQPLHCATNADAGGNCLRTQGFGQDDLHATWDTGLVAQIMEDTHGHRISEVALANALDAEYGGQFSGNIPDFDQMAVESRDIAFQAVYGPMLERGILPGVEPRPYMNVRVSRCPTETMDFYNIHPPVDLTALYNAATLDTLRLQLAKAGYRLAAVLNGLWQ